MGKNVEKEAGAPPLPAISTAAASGGQQPVRYRRQASKTLSALRVTSRKLGAPQARLAIRMVPSRGRRPGRTWGSPDEHLPYQNLTGAIKYRAIPRVLLPYWIDNNVMISLRVLDPSGPRER